MTAPKSRGTKSKRDKKRLHIILKKPNLVKCKKCNKSIRSHTVCPFCGYYKGRQVLNILSKKEKEEIQKKKKEGKEGSVKKSLDLKKLSKK